MKSALDLEAILPHLWISGRSSRAEWWRVHILCAVFAVMAEHAMMNALAPRSDGSIPPINLLWPVITLAPAWVSFASVVRRFHDRGKSSWWALLYFVPFVGWLWIVIECGLLPGKPNVTYTDNPAPAPAPAAPASRSAARLQTAATVRTGAVQRTEYQPWDRKRVVKLVGNAISLVLVAFIAYKVLLGPSGQAIFSEINQPFRSGE